MPEPQRWWLRLPLPALGLVVALGLNGYAPFRYQPSSYFFWGGLIVAATAVVALARPLRFQGLGRRRRSGALLLAALCVSTSALLWPPPRTEASRGSHAIDGLQPNYQFMERHSLGVRASAAQVFDASQSVTVADLRGYNTLMHVRAFLMRARSPQPQANPRPLLKSSIALANNPGHERVFAMLFPLTSGSVPRVSTPADLRALHNPAWAKVVFNIRVEPEGQGAVRVFTETRVQVDDPRAAARFARYWRLIYPGSAILRVSWLNAIRLRAERMSAQSS